MCAKSAYKEFPPHCITGKAYARKNRGVEKVWTSSPAITRGLEWGVLQGRVKDQNWYAYHCRTSLAMTVDLFVLPGLCFQSLSAVYFRFHCRPLTTLIYQCHIKPGNCGLCWCGTQTNKDEMNCSIKVGPLVWAHRNTRISVLRFARDKFTVPLVPLLHAASKRFCAPQSLSWLCFSFLELAVTVVGHW